MSIHRWFVCKGREQGVRRESHTGSLSTKSSMKRQGVHEELVCLPGRKGGLPRALANGPAMARQATWMCDVRAGRAATNQQGCHLGAPPHLGAVPSNLEQLCEIVKLPVDVTACGHARVTAPQQH